jgi:type IV secretory pathway VirJ component
MMTGMSVTVHEWMPNVILQENNCLFTYRVIEVSSVTAVMYKLGTKGCPVCRVIVHGGCIAHEACICPL